MRFVVGILLMIQVCTYSSNSDLSYKAFELAVQHGQYSQARQIANQMLLENPSSASTWQYNLAHIAYKNDQFGQAIFHYQEALKRSPRDPDILYNLNLVRQQRVDDLMPEKHWSDSFFWPLSFLSVQEQWLMINSLLFLSLLSALFLLKRFIWFKRMIIVSGIILIWLFVLYGPWKKSVDQAVLVTPSAKVYAGPMNQLDVLFVIHDGAEGTILFYNDDWVHIGFHNGFKGWIERRYLELF